MLQDDDGLPAKGGGFVAAAAAWEAPLRPRVGPAQEGGVEVAELVHLRRAQHAVVDVAGGRIGEGPVHVDPLEGPVDVAGAAHGAPDKGREGLGPHGPELEELHQVRGVEPLRQHGRHLGHAPTDEHGLPVLQEPRRGADHEFGIGKFHFRHVFTPCADLNDRANVGAGLKPAPTVFLPLARVSLIAFFNGSLPGQFLELRPAHMFLQKFEMIPDAVNVALQVLLHLGLGLDGV